MVSLQHSQIINRCISLLEERISHARMAMNEAQEAANNEEKSSAGDKYETGRAMAQLSRDMNARQLSNAIQELAFLKQLTQRRETHHAGPGCLIETESDWYFIGAGLGTLIIDDIPVICISAHSPIAKILSGRKTGDSIQFMNRIIRLKAIH